MPSIGPACDASCGGTSRLHNLRDDMRTEDPLRPDPADVFGSAALRMPTAEAVEVIRQPAAADGRLRYSKAFLAIDAGDFSAWTLREWQMLRRLSSRPEPIPTAQIAAFEVASAGGPARLQTFDAGISVQRWSLLQPVREVGAPLRHVFEDCAHWWALAHHGIAALARLHAQGVVHLDLKADNVCIPMLPVGPGPADATTARRLAFDGLTFIDFAFAVFTGEAPEQPLPIAPELRHDYQSPRLLDALEAGRRGDSLPAGRLDWRCDLFSFAAMLWLYLPEPEEALASGWTAERHAQAGLYVRRLLDEHNADLPEQRPHAELAALAAKVLSAPELLDSLQRGWRFQVRAPAEAVDWAAPGTRLIASSARSVAAPRPASAREALATPPSDAAPVPLPERESDAEVSGVSRSPDQVQIGPAAASRSSTAGLAPAAAGAAAGSAPTPRLPASAADAAGAAGAPDMAAAGVPGPLKPSAPTDVEGASPVALARGGSPERVQNPTAAAGARVAAHEPMSSADGGRLGPEGPTQLPPRRGRRPTAAVAAALATIGVALAAVFLLGRSGAPEPRGADRVAGTDASRLKQGGYIVGSGPAPSAASAAASARVPEVPVAAATTALPGASTPASAERAAAGASVALNTGAADLSAAASMSAGASTPSVRAEVGRGGGAAPVAKPRVAASPRPAPRDGADAPSATASEVAHAFGWDEEVRPPTPAPPAASRPGVSAEPAGRSASAVAGSVPARQAAPAEADGALPGDAGMRELRSMAQWADRHLGKVLALAGPASAALPRREELRTALAAVRIAPDRPRSAFEVRAQAARRLNESARRAYWDAEDPARALALQEQAFAAHPLDAEIAGNLAFYRMRQAVPQVQAARDLVLHSLTLPDARHPLGRVEDWTTLAIANALIGREDEARQAWVVSLVVATDPQRQRSNAVKARAIYGERLGPSVEALLKRAAAADSAAAAASRAGETLQARDGRLP